MMNIDFAGHTFSCPPPVVCDSLPANVLLRDSESGFYPRDAMLARVFAIATCLDVRLSVCLSHTGIVPSRAKAGS